MGEGIGRFSEGGSKLHSLTWDTQTPAFRKPKLLCAEQMTWKAWQNQWPRVTTVEDTQDWKPLYLRFLFNFLFSLLLWEGCLNTTLLEKEILILLTLLIAVNFWVIHIPLLMPGLEMENKAQFLINKKLLCLHAYMVTNILQLVTILDHSWKQFQGRSKYLLWPNDFFSLRNLI